MTDCSVRFVGGVGQKFIEKYFLEVVGGLKVSLIVTGVNYFNILFSEKKQRLNITKKRKMQCRGVILSYWNAGTAFWPELKRLFRCGTIFAFYYIRTW